MTALRLLGLVVVLSLVRYLAGDTPSLLQIGAGEGPALHTSDPRRVV